MSIFLSFCKASRMRRAKMNDSDKSGAKPQTKSEGICSRFPFHRLTGACTLNGAVVIF